MLLDPTQQSHNLCLNCSMRLKAEDSASGLRCGKNYFVLAPKNRKPQPLRHYPETQPTNTCDSWVSKQPASGKPSAVDFYD